MTRLGGQVPTFDVSDLGQGVETVGASAGTVVVPTREGETATRPGGVGILAPGTRPVPTMPESSAATERRADL